MSPWPGAPIAIRAIASDSLGAVHDIYRSSERHFNDAKRYVDAVDIPDADKQKVFKDNARQVRPRMNPALKASGK